MEAEEYKYKTDKDLAQDVAHLYSLEQVEDVPYRSFSRRRGQEPHPVVLTELDQDDSGSAQSTASLRAAAPFVESATRLEREQDEASRLMSPKKTAAADAEVPLQTPPIDVPEVTFPVAGLSLPASSPSEPELSQGGQNASTAIAIYSLAGGVGKTTIAANLGRIFCSRGEQVLLVDASGSGLLPFYFGASDLRFGLRTFIAPGGSCTPMHVIGAEDVTAKWLESDVAPLMKLDQRTIFDLGSASMAVLPQLLQMCAVLLVPLLSDLNSFLTVPRIESSIRAMRGRGVPVPLPLYAFNKVDADSQMDREARNLVTRQCGDRLLPVSIRRSSDIPTAISDRMTVADHFPKSEVTHDFLELATRLEEIAPVREAINVKSHGRWSER